MLLSKNRSMLSNPKVNSPMSFSRYAPQYDRLASLNPAYQENLDRFTQVVQKIEFTKNPVVCDVGAGTGNYICAMQCILPDARYIHIDSDHEMNAIALDKYQSNNFENVKIVEDYCQRVDHQAESLDFIICVNSLYAMQPQTLILKKLHSWLKPGGILFVIDFGRQHDVLDWGYYMFTEIAKKYGYVRAAREMLNLLSARRENANTTKGQKSGAYWTHSTREFEKFLLNQDFEILEIEECYRGYSDLAVCKKRASAERTNVSHSQA